MPSGNETVAPSWLFPGIKRNACVSNSESMRPRVFGKPFCRTSTRHSTTLALDPEEQLLQQHTAAVVRAALERVSRRAAGNTRQARLVSLVSERMIRRSDSGEQRHEIWQNPCGSPFGVRGRYRPTPYGGGG